MINPPNLQGSVAGSSERLATLHADPDGKCDIYRQATYAGGMIPRNYQGLMLDWVNAGHRPETGRHLYQSLCIRLTGGFDD